MQTFQNIMLVGSGGFIGSVLRYLVSVLMQQSFKTDSFPAGTAVVNVTGCLVIGLLGGWAENGQALGPQTRLFLFLGLLGGFTTFSTFGYETVALLRDKAVFLAFINVIIQLSLGFGAVLLGYNCWKML
ncbi:MAG: fluoride efflux transporter CrcB [Deltaproteobacteria bacterium]|nr:fluoride efflux transporter CrcB [Deltaproteobacteria bacterium]